MTLSHIRKVAKECYFLGFKDNDKLQDEHKERSTPVFIKTIKVNW